VVRGSWTSAWISANQVVSGSFEFRRVARHRRAQQLIALGACPEVALGAGQRSGMARRQSARWNSGCKRRGNAAAAAAQGAIAGQYHGKRRFLRFTSVDGVSDILGVLRPQGLLLALEVKRPGRRTTPKQEAFLATVRDHGGIGACVQSVAELEQIFPTWCPPLP